MARSSRPRSSANPINWPLAFGIAGVAGVGAWYLITRQAAAARLEAARRLAAAQNPLLIPPVQTSPPQQGAPHAGGVSDATVRALQTELNSFTTGNNPNRCTRLDVDGAWGRMTSAVLACWVSLATHTLIPNGGGRYFEPNVPGVTAAMGEANARSVINQIRSTKAAIMAAHGMT